VTCKPGARAAAASRPDVTRIPGLQSFAEDPRPRAAGGVRRGPEGRAPSRGGRVDDVINVSGHRLSTAEIESALVSHPAVAEAAVIAAADDLTGQAVVAYVTLGSGAVPGADLETRLREHVGRQIGKLARPSRIIWTDDLPKTRCGKIMRRLLRDITEDREPGDLTTLRDPSVLAQLHRNARVGPLRDAR
jgi:acetyl-CoA synthetase